jgi:uncharacterized protein YutE (UPF0331/DUF86 family)
MENLLPRLKQLEENIIELNDFKNISLKDILNDTKLMWALRYGFFECIQMVIDISCSLVSSFNLGNPKNYLECLEILKKEKYLSVELADSLIQSIGLRNILIHEYFNIDSSILYQSLSNIGDFTKFVEEITLNFNDILEY